METSAPLVCRRQAALLGEKVVLDAAENTFDPIQMFLARLERLVDVVQPGLGSQQLLFLTLQFVASGHTHFF